MKMKLKRLISAIFAVLIIFSLSGCDLFKGVTHKPTPDPLPHLIAESLRETAPIRPYDSFTEGISIKADAPVNQQQYRLDRELNRLSAVLQRGKLPSDIEDCHLSVKSVTVAARAVLNDIILNNMTEYERVHAIHDYLTYKIEYNNELYDKYVKGEEIDAYHEAFDVRGVFLDKKAVCDGLSKAFVLMCAMEGIRAVQVTGEAFSGKDESGNNRKIPHAWNRVLLDGEWYNVDCTFDAFNVSVNGTLKKFMSHSYFLIDTASMKEHTVSAVRDHDNDKELVTYTNVALDRYAANVYYDFYSREDIAKINNIRYTHSVNSQAGLNAIFRYISDSDFAIGKIELRLTFMTVEEDWAHSITEAYRQVSNANYNEDAALRRINNTVFFFIYT